jgi:predicted nucleic acid-binding protein
VGALVLDASAAIGFLDPTDAHHRRATERIAVHYASTSPLLLPASAYAEMLVRPLRAGTADGFEAFVDRQEVELVPVDRALARAAARLRADHASLRLGDALVLATARVRDADLLTFDDRLRRIAGQHLP